MMSFVSTYTWNSPGKNTGVGSHSPLNPGIKPRSTALQVDSLPSEPAGKSYLITT